jgi:hypothetical protein
MLWTLVVDQYSAYVRTARRLHRRVTKVSKVFPIGMTHETFVMRFPKPTAQFNRTPQVSVQL